MFSIGFGEILVIGVLALLVIGPKQLPEVARVLGRLIGELKKATQDLSGGLLDASRVVKTAVSDAKNEIQGTVDGVKSKLDPNALLKEDPTPTKETIADSANGSAKVTDGSKAVADD